VRIRVDNVSKGFGDVLPALNDALTARCIDAVATAEPFFSRLEATGVGVTILQTGDAFPWQIATVMFSDQFARDRAHAVSLVKGYVKASRHHFDAGWPAERLGVRRGRGHHRQVHGRQLRPHTQGLSLSRRWPRRRSWTRAFCATHCGRSREGACRMIKGDP
jgi:hypothetical protein